jgi:phytoene dehydrogenase-like protein
MPFRGTPRRGLRIEPGCSGCSRQATSRDAGKRVVGGWGVLVDRLAERAATPGIEFHLETRVVELPAAPVIVATELADARKLFLDQPLEWPSGNALCLDIGLRSRRGDPSAVIDLDDGMLLERQTTRDRSVAPDGHELIQAHVGIRPGETTGAALDRLERRGERLGVIIYA